MRQGVKWLDWAVILGTKMQIAGQMGYPGNMVSCADDCTNQSWLAGLDAAPALPEAGQFRQNSAATAPCFLNQNFLINPAILTILLKSLGTKYPL